MDINTSIDKSIAFEASKVESKDRTNKELEEQAQNFSQLLAKTNKTEEISYKTTINSENNIITTFEDPRNGKMVAVSLQKDTISKLEEFFSKDDFRKNEDGSITLDNKAESYVASWYEDIAYKREFLKADANADGKLSKEEYNQTKNNFEANIKVTVNKDEKLSVSVEESIGKSYIDSQESDSFTSIYRSSNRATSLDDELNMTLMIDENFDSKIDIEEAYSTDKTTTVEELLLSHVNSLKIEDVLKSKLSQEEDETLSVDFQAFFNDILSLAVTLLLNAQNEELKEALEKLKLNDGDASSLDSLQTQIIQDVLKLEPKEGKYELEDIQKVLDILEKYELKDDSKKEENLEISIDKVSI